jgi:hypothetical protein
MDDQFINFIWMKTQADAYGFRKEFDYDGVHYSVHVIPFMMANEKDRGMYNLEEGQFLVHLFDGNAFQSFSVFYGSEQPVWESNVSKIVLDDKDLIEKIGFLIDDYYA